MVVRCLIVHVYSCSSLDMHSIELLVLSSLVASSVVFLVSMVILSYHILLVVLMCCSTHLKLSFALSAFQYLTSFTETQVSAVDYEAPWYREPLLGVSYGST